MGRGGVRISEGERDVRILRALHAGPEDQRAALPPREAVWTARSLLDPDELLELGELLGWSGSLAAIERRVLDDVASGRLLVVVHEVRLRASRAAPRVDVVESAGEYKAPPEEKRDWFFVQIEDEDGRPLPGKRYELTTADGKKYTGASNAQGIVHVVGIAPGMCQFSLVDQDGADWEKV